MDREVTSAEPRQLVEHFFRHESAKLVAVLTRAFGLRRLDLIEDQVQEAMLTAVGAWRHGGIPKNPAGWLHRVARNRILDVLRREKVHQRAVALAGQTEASAEYLVDTWLSEDQLPDSLLRMMFVCCHPCLDRHSQIAMTLKILCGFSVAEIARGLLMSAGAVKKRIQRAKQRLAEQQVRLDLPSPNELQARLGTVHNVLYLMFNEGYSTSHGIEPLRDDVCEEAARLCQLLCEHQDFSTPETRALLALMLFHAARLDARVDADGAAVLLEDQDRERWDRRLIRSAQHWLARSKTVRPSRFHLEAAIALHHCLAPSVAETRWHDIVGLYDRLLSLVDSPIYVLNRAIARAQAGDLETAMSELESIREQRQMRDYFHLDCAVARLHELAGRTEEALDAYAAALTTATAPHAKSFLEKKVARLRR